MPIKMVLKYLVDNINELKDKWFDVYFTEKIGEYGEIHMTPQDNMACFDYYHFFSFLVDKIDELRFKDDFERALVVFFVQEEQSLPF